ncbi:MAG: SAM-dependent methyltransferase [Sphingomonadaceae bacterium]
MAEIFFDKYERKGAYHWTETTGSVHRLNAYTLGRYEQVLAALGRIPPDAAILDVGCGDGALAGAIAARLGCVVEGVDVDELPITLARNEFEKRGLRGRFQVTRLDYAGDFNGERTYTLTLESSGAVVPA